MELFIIFILSGFIYSILSFNIIETIIPSRKLTITQVTLP